MRDNRDPQAVGNQLLSLATIWKHKGTSHGENDPYPGKLSRVYDAYASKLGKAPDYTHQESVVNLTTEKYRQSLADEAIEGVIESHRRLFELVPDDDEREQYLADATARVSTTLTQENGRPVHTPASRVYLERARETLAQRVNTDGTVKCICSPRDGVHHPDCPSAWEPGTRDE